jgi:hypothetical protein
MKKTIDFTRDLLKSREFHKILPCDELIPYLLQKYISGVSPQYCDLINSLLNSKLSVWKDEQEILDFLTLIIPKKTNTYFKYFKTSPLKKEDMAKIDLDYLSDTLEMSKREIYEMIKNFPEIAEDLKEKSEKILKARK